MKEYEIGNFYAIDLEALWRKFAAKPEEEGEIDLTDSKTLRHTKEEENDYYDLFNRLGTIVCMDGEVCQLLYENEDLFELVEEDTQIRFKMSRKEFETAVMC